MHLVPVPGGRVLECLEVGDPGGRPVVYLHGTPGTAGCAALLDGPARRQGVRLVAVSRPGYGGSATTAPGLTSVGADIGELTAALGIEEFAVLGTSGGGPFALAVAAAVPERVRRVGVAAGPGSHCEVAPEVLDAQDFLALDLLAAGDVAGAMAVLTTSAAAVFDAMTGLPASEFVEAFSRVAPPTEHYFDSRPADRDVFFADLHRALSGNREGYQEGGYQGYVRDNLSWLGPWDFEPAEVVAPVVLSYGEADAMVPRVHGEWLAARLPTSSLTVHPGAGHGDVTFGLAEWMLARLD